MKVDTVIFYESPLTVQKEEKCRTLRVSQQAPSSYLASLIDKQAKCAVHVQSKSTVAQVVKAIVLKCDVVWESEYVYASDAFICA
jgi:hypothetical protein